MTGGRQASWAHGVVSVGFGVDSGEDRARPGRRDRAIEGATRALPYFLPSSRHASATLVKGGLPCSKHRDTWSSSVIIAATGFRHWRPRSAGCSGAITGKTGPTSVRFG